MTIEEVKNLRTGDKIRTIVTLGAIKKGEKFEFSYAMPSGNTIYAYTTTGNAFLPNQVERINVSIAELVIELESKEKEIVLIKSQIAYMQENKLEIFDSNEFKVWNTLNLLEDKKMSKLEKAKAIARMIDNK
jgi:hypothetical protein